MDAKATSGLNVLIVSSTEGRDVARDLRGRLPRSWDLTLWDEDVLPPGRSALDGLLSGAAALDAALVIVTADDVCHQRGEEHRVPRDNIVFEAGLFMGLLGADRALLVHDDAAPAKLPSDLAGITRVGYRSTPGHGPELATLDEAARRVERTLARLGPRHRPVPPADDDTAALQGEVRRLAKEATARGWTVDHDDGATAQFRHPGPIELRLPVADPSLARAELRSLALVLHKLGVRVAQDLLPKDPRT